MELLVKALSTKTKLIQQFREAVYLCITKRADAFVDLPDAPTVAGHVESPVALSEEQPFRRNFSSIFDTLLECEFDFDQPMNSLHSHQPSNSETIAVYAVYAVDSNGPKDSWLARLIHWGSAWVAPVDVQRVETVLTDNQVTDVLVQELDARI